MRARITQAVKDAMKSGDKARLGTLRLMMAAIKDRDIAASLEKAKDTSLPGEIGEAEILAVLQKMVKQRRDSIASFEQGGRADLVAKEAAEIAVIEEYLPKQMSEAEAAAAVKALVAELGATSVKDMGKVMGALKQRFTGQMDFSKASNLVKDALK